ncbi:hypothetical protein CGCS363_v014902 [Colletotrichum siamense]|uniref:uncharacterized protein n=1 Tax=Colletotrichum siamense TaxID=690259 RepID=UPI0018731A36|nr:uncharacterized protein CGCS363_v014902 [Colletotrichum siamense]KAF5484902.1 hypothetical protein CGCS363_v014902 [Colletotrichum siamense]
MARWFWMQKELRQCRDKARDARAALQLALATLNLKSTVQMSLYVERFALRPASHHDSESATDIETDVSQEIFNFPTASASESKSNDDKHHILPRQEVEREAGPLSLLFTNGRPSDEKKLVGMDMVVFRARLSEKQGVEAVKGSMLAYGRLLPDDRSSAGWDIMLMAITWATPEVLEFMTGLWAEDLRKDTFNP